MSESVQGHIPYPPPECFKIQRPADDILAVTRANSQLDPLPVIERIEATPEGFRVYHKGSKFPTKGWPTPHAVNSIYMPKKVLISWISFLGTKDLVLPILALAILPKKVKVRILERFIHKYSDISDLTMADYYFDDKFYMNFSKAIMKLVSTFLITIGIREDSAKHFGEIFGMFMELDTAYRYRAEDIFSETTKEKLLNDPAGEIKRLIGLLVLRDGSKHAAANFEAMGLALRVVLFIPWIKKAFRTAINAIDLKDLQLDDADKYHVCQLNGYNFFGETIEERVVKYPRERLEAYTVI